MVYSDPIPEFLMLMMGCCNWNSGVIIYEFEGSYDPAYLNLDRNDKDAWKIYAEKVRDVMAKCLKVPKVDFGYRNWKEF